MKLLSPLSIGASAILAITFSSCAATAADTPSKQEIRRAAAKAPAISAEEQSALAYIQNIETFSEIMKMYSTGKLNQVSTVAVVENLTKEITSMDSLIWGDSEESKKVQSYLNGKYAARLQSAKELAEENLDANLEACISYSMSQREPSAE